VLPTNRAGDEDELTLAIDGCSERLEQSEELALSSDELLARHRGGSV
jgi:hypothetical protein